MLTFRSHSLLLVFIITIITPYTYQLTVRSLTSEESESLQSRIKRKVMCMTATTGSEKMTFPGEEVERSVLRAVVSPGTPAPCPNDEPYCTSTDDYPKDRIKAILQQQPRVLLNHFYVDKPDDILVDKFAGSGETTLCATKTEIVYPTKAKSKEGFYEFVVNDEKNQQGVKVERCLSKEMSCNSIVSFPLGYKSHCEQKYVTRVLVVAETNQSDVHGFVSKPFDFPSCCSCVLKLQQEPSRFGQSAATPSRKPTNQKS